MLNLRGDSSNIANCGLTPQIDALKGRVRRQFGKNLLREQHRRKQEMAPAFSFGVMAGLTNNNLCRMIGMNNLEDRPPPAVGVYWINEEDYPALLELFADGNKMPLTWKEWLKMAEEMERGLKAYGHVVMRVHIDPNTFSDWCAAHDTSPGGEGRKRFVAATVTERYGDQN